MKTSLKQILVTLLSLFVAGVYAQNIGVNTDGSLPSTLFHTKNTTAGEDNILRIENTIGNRETGINLLNSTTANANWKFYIPASSDALRLYNGSDLFTILQNGNVGIGITDPTSTAASGLSAGKVIQVRSSNVSENTSLYLRRSDAAVGLDITSENGSDGIIYLDSRYNSATFGGFQFRTRTEGTAISALKIRGDGNVGIGTTEPDSKLNVMGAITSTTFDWSTNGLNTNWRWQSYLTSDNLHFYSRGLGADVLTFDYTTGNVGIGTTAPAGKFEVVNASGGTSAPNYFQVTGSTANNSNYPGISFRGGTLATTFPSILLGNGGLTLILGGGSSATYNITSSLALCSNNSGNAYASISVGSERMRVTDTGFLLVGKTSSGIWPPADGCELSSTGYAILQRNSAGNSPLYVINSATSGTRGLVYFGVGASASAVGSINTDGSTTTYNTSSDYRLKENVIEIGNASVRVQSLKPVRFNFIANPGKTVDGFLAHEVAEVVPEAVTGVKDETDAEGNPLYQGVDYSKLVPLLTAALQEALAEIENLKTRLAVLESGDK